MIRFKKTPQNERGTYKYYYGNRKVICELKPGVDGVTDFDIKMLHQEDDREVYYNNKQNHGIRTNKEKEEIRKWKKQYALDYKAEHGFEPTDYELKDAANKEFPMIKTLSLNAYESEGYAGDKNDLEFQAYLIKELNNFNNPRIERLYEVIAELDEEQQWLINKIHFEEESQTEVAKQLGISKQAVNKRLKNLYKLIKEKF